MHLLPIQVEVEISGCANPKIADEEFRGNGLTLKSNGDNFKSYRVIDYNQ